MSEPDEGFVLHPGEFVLGSTLETVTLPDDDQQLGLFYALPDAADAHRRLESREVLGKIALTL